MSDEQFEVDVDDVKAATNKALLCVVDGDEEWIPRSQILDGDIEEVGDSGSMIITAWLAREKGWL
jgi:hypothetical protein